MSNRIPALHKKRSGQCSCDPRCKKGKCPKIRQYAAVTLSDGFGRRREVILGRWGDPNVQAEYQRITGEWLANKRRLVKESKPVDGLTVSEMLLAYLEYASVYYRYPDGSPTNELSDIKLSIRPLRKLYGHTLAETFGPLSLEAVREFMINQPVGDKVGLCRGVINQRIGKIIRAFRWAVSKEMIPVTVLNALEAVQPLQRHRSAARETEAVRPVSEALVNDTLPFLSPTVSDMIQVQLLTGMRSGEVCIMRGCDLDTTGEVWLFRPSTHKTMHVGKDRVIALGPQAQEIVKRYLKTDTQAYLFSPREDRERRFAEMRTRRKTPVQPSQICRKKKKPVRVPGVRYTPRAMAHAVQRACKRGRLESWHPHQLRHSHATEVRRQFGLEAAQVALGHSGAKVTEIYAEKNLDLAKKVAAKVG
jgi:integrase